MAFFDIINYVAQVDKLLLFLINAVGFELVLWAYVANRYTRPNRLILCGVFYVLLWANADAIGTLAQVFFADKQAPMAALWATRSLYALLSAFFAGFYLFSLNFPARNHYDKSNRGKENLQIAAWTFFFATSFTPLIVGSVAFDASLPWAAWIVPGPLFWVYAAFAFLTLAFSFSELSHNRRFADPGNRALARFTALGAGVFGVSNLVFNVAGSVFGGWMAYLGFFSLFVDYVIVVFLSYLAYQAVREQLFGIKVILVEIFVGLMGASLAVMPFFVGLLWQRALLIILFLLFCCFGYLLVKSTIKEYREKEGLEQKVLERTKELEGAKQNLEETNSALEIRVKARTRELEKLNRTLEEKIASRTNDLEAKIKALETFQRITVGRELKMIELKKEIEFLRATIYKADASASK